MGETAGLRRIAKRPVFWTLIAAVLVACGLDAVRRIPLEVLPRFDFPQVSIVTHVAGDPAQTLESQIVRPLEGQILALPDLVSVRSVIGNGEVVTDVRFRRSTEPEQDLLAINSAIDRARGQLPPGAKPLAQIMGDAINEVADYTARIPASVAPALVERRVRADILPALRALPGVQRVELFGTGDEALWIQPDLAAMRRYDVPVTAITHAVKANVLLAPGGYITQGHQDVLIEARQLPVHIAEVEQIPVAGPHGPIPLRNLARVVRAATPTHNAVLLDGRPAISMIVFKQPGASTIPVTRAVQTLLETTKGQLPKGVSWVRIYNQGHLVHLVSMGLGLNLLIGGLLAIGILLWVLGAGRGIWVLACSIPLSLLMAITALNLAGQSLNLMTLGALTVAVGLLADDAIIVLESIYHRWEQGDERWAGVLRGVQDIAIPDISGTLTVIAVFVPLLFVGGLAGLFFVPFALAMSFALAASLLVSLSFIPLCLGFMGARPRKEVGIGGRWLEWLRRWNEKLFDLVIRVPRASLAITFGLLALSLAGLTFTTVNFLPLPNEGVLLMSFTLPPGSALVDTEAAVRKMTRKLEQDPAVAHVSARIGSAGGTFYTEPAYAGEIEIPLEPSVKVSSLNAIASRLQKEARLTSVQTAVDTPTVERVGESLSGLPQPFVIHLFGASVSRLRKLADRVTARLRKVPTLSSIFNNDGYPVTQLQLTPKAAALNADGLTPAQLYAQLGPLLNGSVVAKVQQGNVPLDLYVRLANAPAKSIRQLKMLPVRIHPSRSGRDWTRLGQLASLDLVTTPNQIRHIDGARALDIFATPTGPLGSTIAAAKQELKGLHLPAGYRIAFGGLYPQLVAAAEGLGVASLAAFVIMAGILVLQFEGLLVPGLLLVEIPLAMIGGAVALTITGVGLNAIGLVAFLTLIGIGLNHGIVLLDRIRRNEAGGMVLEEAVREGIHVRFRPIVLTTLTAILGMLPTALGLGQGAAPEQGLAVVILGGVLWSALLSTNLIPGLYLYWRRKQLANATA